MHATLPSDWTVEASLDSLISRDLGGALVLDRQRHPAGYVSLSTLQQAVRDGESKLLLEQVPRQPVAAIQVAPGESITALLVREYRDHSPSSPVAVIDPQGELQEVLTASQVAARCVDGLGAQLGRLQEENHQFLLILELISDMITVSDARGVILWANGAVEALFGWSVRDIVGSNVFNLERSGVVSRSSTAMVLRTGERQSLIQETKVGRQLMVTSWPIFSERGEIHRIINITRDVTEVNHLQQRLKEVEAAAERYRQRLVEVQPPRLGRRGYVTRSQEMHKVSELVRQVAGVNTTVLITGESGCGKEVLAQQLHELGPRAQKPFIRINCGAIPDSLLESELFGYAPGAFTGAAKGGKPGLIEMAEGGTLFLDEVGELPLALQVKILRAIQEREVQRVGGTQPVRVDFRLIAATNRNLEEMVAQGKFRADLFYRINVVPIHVPPLRERQEDIPLLIHHFLERFGSEYGKHRHVSPEAIEVLVRYPFPGNVRELENLIERLVVTVPDEFIEVRHLPEAIRSSVITISEGTGGQLSALKEAVETLEERLLRQAYDLYGTVHGVARALGLDPSTASRKMRKYKVT